MNKKHLSSQAEGLILWGSLLCTIIITKATKSKSKEQFQQVELVLPSVLGVCRENKAWVLLCLTHTSCLAQGPIYLLPLKLILRFPVLSRVLLFAILWTIAHQAPLAMGFSKQEYWSWLPFPSPGDLPDPGIEPPSLSSPALASIFFTAPSLKNSFKWGLVIIEENNFVWRKAKSLSAYKKHAFWWLFLSIIAVPYSLIQALDIYDHHAKYLYYY